MTTPMIASGAIMSGVNFHSEKIPNNPNDPNAPDAEALSKASNLTGNNNVPFVNIKVGEGGTFRFPAADRARIYPIHAFGWKKEEVQSVRFIGTTHCSSGVGVYMPIRENMCFCAHIDVYNGKEEGGILDFDQKNEVSVRVQRQLRRHSKAHAWEYTDIDPKWVILSCNRPGLVAEAIRDAIGDFLHMPSVHKLRVHAPIHGFVVNPDIFTRDEVNGSRLLLGTPTDDDDEHDFREVHFPPSGDPKWWTYTTGWRDVHGDHRDDDRGWGAEFIPRRIDGSFRTHRMV